MRCVVYAWKFGSKKQIINGVVDGIWAWSNKLMLTPLTQLCLHRSLVPRCLHMSAFHTSHNKVSCTHCKLCNYGSRSTDTVALSSSHGYWRSSASCKTWETCSEPYSYYKWCKATACFFCYLRLLKPHISIWSHLCHPTLLTVDCGCSPIVECATVPQKLRDRMDCEHAETCYGRLSSTQTPRSHEFVFEIPTRCKVKL